jgi:hypothetical protein
VAGNGQRARPLVPPRCQGQQAAPKLDSSRRLAGSPVASTRTYAAACYREVDAGRWWDRPASGLACPGRGASQRRPRSGRGLGGLSASKPPWRRPACRCDLRRGRTARAQRIGGARWVTSSPWRQRAFRAEEGSRLWSNARCDHGASHAATIPSWPNPAPEPPAGPAGRAALGSVAAVGPAAPASHRTDEHPRTPGQGRLSQGRIVACWSDRGSRSRQAAFGVAGRTCTGGWPPSCRVAWREDGP